MSKFNVVVNDIAIRIKETKRKKFSYEVTIEDVDIEEGMHGGSFIFDCTRAQLKTLSLALTTYVSLQESGK